MKNYNEYENFDAFREDLNKELESLQYPITTVHISRFKTKTNCKITKLSASTTGQAIIATVELDELDSRPHQYSLYDNGHWFFEFDEESPIPELQTMFYEAYIAMQQLQSEQQLKQFEEEKQAKLEAKKAEAEAEKAVKAQKAFEQRKEKALKDFNELAAKTKEKSSVNGFYYALGWLAKHVGVVSASIPDYLEASFVKHFGTEAKRTVVDSSKKTVSGYAMQWSYSFSATLKKPDLIPSELEQYLDQNRKKVTNTQFIWELVDTYGFKFSKSQDVAAIKATIPTDYIADFEAGIEASSAA